MALPKILIIDDQLGAVRKDGRNRLREDLCLTVGLRDATGDATADAIDHPLAEAVFCRGQIDENGNARNDLAGALELVRSGWKRWPRWALLLLDLQFRTGTAGSDREPTAGAMDSRREDYFGLSILEHLWGDPALRDIPVVILSSMSRAQIENRFADRGVFDFVDKNDLTRERLRQLIESYGLLESETVIGRSVPFLKCLRDGRQRAKMANDNVLLLGETGTGKELLARYIHDHSPRHSGPYVTVYTQGVPETLVDDRLFGHEKGAYTGAIGAQAGAAEEANRGTLFVDEFGDIPASIQSKLLRLLDKNVRESQRMGSKATRNLDLQVVLATNRLDIFESEDFRKDLLFRVGIADAIRVPALRERLEDIPLLTEHFVRKCEQAFRDNLGAEPRAVSTEALEALCGADWPGNVRGLEQAIESAVYRFPKLRVLSAGHLRLPAKSVRAAVESTSASRVPSEPISSLTATSIAKLLQQLRSVEFAETPAARSTWAGKLPELQTTFAGTAASLLRAALVATRKPTPQNPEGEIRIHPAMKLATGDDTLSASTAADIIKRVISFDPDVQKQLMTDPILSEAYKIAVRLRPKTRRTRESSAP